MGVLGQVALLDTVLQVVPQEPRLLPHCGSAITSGLPFLGWNLCTYLVGEERVEGYGGDLSCLGLGTEPITFTICSTG